MSSSAVRDRVADLLAPVIDDTGLDMEAVELVPAGRRTVLRVVVDADGGVTLDQLATTSRAVASALDSSDVMGARAYTLEVTSRGVDRPLTAPRHWQRNVGRLVKADQHDGSQLVGRVVAADNSGAHVEVDGHQHRVAYTDVARARVQVEFSKLPADGPSADGSAADEPAADAGSGNADDEE